MKFIHSLTGYGDSRCMHAALYLGVRVEERWCGGRFYEGHSVSLIWL